VSLRRVDPRFVLPHPPGTAVVFEGIDGWREGLREAGVELLPSDRAGAADLVVAPVRAGAEAAASGAPAVILEGRKGSRSLRRSYEHVQRFLPLPDGLEPQVLVPLDNRTVTRYVLRQWSLPRGLVRRVRNAAADALLTRMTLPEIRPSLTVATREAAPPFLVAAAGDLGVPGDVEWFLTLGHGDVLTRAVFHLFERGSESPSWVLKFSRVTGYADPFDRDERALRLVAAGGPTVAAHAPRLLGRFQAAGLHAALETAAVGRKLTLFLQRRGNTEAKRRLIDAIAAWLIEVGLATRAGPAELETERIRLREEVLPLWHEHEVADLVDSIPPVPAVLQHNDPGCWNIIVDGPRFTAVDWESARRHGFPLWDLVYFLTDALVHLDGADDPPSRRDHHTGQLWKGEAPSSPILFEWIRRGARAFDIRLEDVGPIVTLGWLHHGSSPVRRADLGDEHGVLLDRADPGPVALRAAQIWLSEPELGRDWSSWRSQAGAR
jgi:Phosphotransferase enzyme family